MVRAPPKPGAIKPSIILYEKIFQLYEKILLPGIFTSLVEASYPVFTLFFWKF